jgi:hypothetical protein
VTQVFGYWPDIHELDVPPVNAVDVFQQIRGINFGAEDMGQINVLIYLGLIIRI